MSDKVTWEELIRNTNIKREMKRRNQLCANANGDNGSAANGQNVNESIGTGSNANGSIDNDSIANGSKGNESIANASIGTGSNANGSDANGQKVDDSIGNGSIGNGSIGNGSIGNGSIGNGSIGNGSIGNGSIGNGSIGNGSIGNGSIGNGSVAHGSVANGSKGEVKVQSTLPDNESNVKKTTDKVSETPSTAPERSGPESSVGRPEKSVASGSIGTSLIGKSFIGKSFIGKSLIGTGSIGTGSIGTGSIGTGSIGTGSIGTGSIGTGSIGTGSIGTGSIANGSVANGSESKGKVQSTPPDYKKGVEKKSEKVSETPSTAPEPSGPKSSVGRPEKTVATLSENLKLMSVTTTKANETVDCKRNESNVKEKEKEKEPEKAMEKKEKGLKTTEPTVEKLVEKKDKERKIVSDACDPEAREGFKKSKSSEKPKEKRVKEKNELSTRSRSPSFSDRKSSKSHASSGGSSEQPKLDKESNAEKHRSKRDKSEKRSSSDRSKSRNKDSVRNDCMTPRKRNLLRDDSSSDASIDGSEERRWSSRTPKKPSRDRDSKTSSTTSKDHSRQREKTRSKTPDGRSEKRRDSDRSKSRNRSEKSKSSEKHKSITTAETNETVDCKRNESNVKEKEKGKEPEKAMEKEEKGLKTTEPTAEKLANEEDEERKICVCHLCDPVFIACDPSVDYSELHSYRRMAEEALRDRDSKRSPKKSKDSRSRTPDDRSEKRRDSAYASSGNSSKHRNHDEESKRVKDSSHKRSDKSDRSKSRNKDSVRNDSCKTPRKRNLIRDDLSSDASIDDSEERRWSSRTPKKALRDRDSKRSSTKSKDSRSKTPVGCSEKSRCNHRKPCKRNLSPPPPRKLFNKDFTHSLERMHKNGLLNGMTHDEFYKRNPLQLLGDQKLHGSFGHSAKKYLGSEAEDEPIIYPSTSGDEPSRKKYKSVFAAYEERRWGRSKSSTRYLPMSDDESPERERYANRRKDSFHKRNGERSEKSSRSDRSKSRNGSSPPPRHRHEELEFETIESVPTAQAEHQASPPQHASDDKLSKSDSTIGNKEESKGVKDSSLERSDKSKKRRDSECSKSRNKVDPSEAPTSTIESPVAPKSVDFSDAADQLATMPQENPETDVIGTVEEIAWTDEVEPLRTDSTCKPPEEKVKGDQVTPSELAPEAENVFLTPPRSADSPDAPHQPPTMRRDDPEIEIIRTVAAPKIARGAPPSHDYDSDIEFIGTVPAPKVACPARRFYFKEPKVEVIETDDTPQTPRKLPPPQHEDVQKETTGIVATPQGITSPPEPLHEKPQEEIIDMAVVPHGQHQLLEPQHEKPQEVITDMAVTPYGQPQPPPQYQLDLIMEQEIPAFGGFLDSLDGYFQMERAQTATVNNLYGNIIQQNNNLAISEVEREMLFPYQMHCAHLENPNDEQKEAIGSFRSKLAELTRHYMTTRRWEEHNPLMVAFKENKDALQALLANPAQLAIGDKSSSLGEAPSLTSLCRPAEDPERRREEQKLLAELRSKAETEFHMKIVEELEVVMAPNSQQFDRASSYAFLGPSLLSALYGTSDPSQSTSGFGTSHFQPSSSYPGPSTYYGHGY